MKSFQKSRASAVTRLLWWCSGTVADIIEECPTESAKYQGIGAAVLFTGLLASLTGGYALYFVFDRMDYAVLFGILWGLLIFNFNRYIVTSIDKRGDFKVQALAALPRIVLAVFIAFVISKPLELKIFEKEIDKQLEQQFLSQTKEHDMLIAEKDKMLSERYLAPIRVEIAEKEKEVSDLKQIVQKYNRELILEVQGKTSTQRRGVGPAAMQIQKYLDETTLRLQTAEKDLSALKNEEKELAQKKTALLENKYMANQVRQEDGLLARLNALGQLKENSPTTRKTDIFVFLLFFFIEISPVFVKLFSAQGIYDELEAKAALLEKADVLDNLDHYYKYKEEKREGEVYRVFSDLIQPVMENKIKSKVEKWNKDTESTYNDILGWLKQNMVDSGSDDMHKFLEAMILKPIAAGILFYTSWTLIHLLTGANSNIKITIEGFLIIFSTGFFLAFLINAITLKRYKDNKKAALLVTVAAAGVVIFIVHSGGGGGLLEAVVPGDVDSPATAAIAMISILAGKFGSDLM